MIELEQAQARITAAISPLRSELISLSGSSGRFLAEELAAPISLPLFDNSAMDGYALCSGDATHASASSPTRLRVLGAVPAGASFDGIVQRGTAVRVFTGSPLPQGADAVVMQEDTRTIGEFVEVLDQVKPWENVRFSGQDIKQGEITGRAGERLGAAQLALLGALGVERLAVTRQPLVAIVSTGSELIEPGSPLAAGQIYESNRASIAALCRGVGAIPSLSPLVSDKFEEIVAALGSAFKKSDVVITTGGASVGEHDLVKAAFESLGGSLEFWRVAVKPGKPFVFGRLGEKFLCGLPGNPVSAFVTFLLLARPALLKLQGATEFHLPTFPATLAEPIHNSGERRHFMRIILDKEGSIRNAGLQASHALASLARANALLDVPPKTSWPAGHHVRALCWAN